MKDTENSREAGKVALSNSSIQKHLCDPLVTEYRYFQRTVAVKFSILFKSQTLSHSYTLLNTLLDRIPPDPRTRSQNNGIHHDEGTEGHWH